MAKTITLVLNDETFKIYKKLKEHFKKTGVTREEFVRLMITSFYKSEVK